MRDGRRVVSVGSDRRLKLWDAETGREVLGMPTVYTLGCVAVHPGRPRLAFGDSAGIVSVVDLHEMAGAEGAGPAAPEPARSAIPQDRAHPTTREDGQVTSETPAPAPQPRHDKPVADAVPPKGADRDEIESAPQTPEWSHGRGMTVVVVVIAAACAAGGYFLTTVSAWLWLVAVPLFLVSLLLLLDALVMRFIECPYCSETTSVIRSRSGTHRCSSCKREFTLPLT